MRRFNSVRVEGAIAYLALVRRDGSLDAEAMVDASDVEFLQSLKLRWYRRYHVGRSRSYVASSFRLKGGAPKNILLHRVLMGCTESVNVIDHLNGNTMDNRRANLRVCDIQTNQRNKSVCRSLSGFLNVRRTTNGERYTVRICRSYIGTFDSAVEAHLAATAYRQTRGLHTAYDAAQQGYVRDFLPQLIESAKEQSA